jgi:hypothetical protein
VDSAGTSIHSDKDSKGVIMALGNVGIYLDTNNINTYLSIDGVSLSYQREILGKKLRKAHMSLN